MDEQEKQEGIVLTEAQLRSHRQRSIAIALALGVLVLLFFRWLGRPRKRV